MIDKSNLKRMIRVAGGKKRVLYTYSADHPKVKKLHDAYQQFLDDHFIPSTFSHAYTKKRSIYTNAKAHMYNDIFIKIDVKQFFPSISHQYLVDEMYYELNRKNPNTISLRECKELVSNSSVHERGLPLGLIPSPTLSNIYMKRFDGKLYGGLKKLELRDLIYTRYADDIFISFKAPKKGKLPDGYFETIVDLCRQELRRCHLTINAKKTKRIDLTVSNHVKIAGINVTTTGDRRRLTVSRKVVRDLYFRAIAAHRASNDEYAAEVESIKGMHSFLLSVEKTSYSHVLSPGMYAHINELGYDKLEDLIAQMRVRDQN